MLHQAIIRFNILPVGSLPLQNTQQHGTYFLTEQTVQNVHVLQKEMLCMIMYKNKIHLHQTHSFQNAMTPAMDKTVRSSVVIVWTRPPVTKLMDDA